MLIRILNYSFLLLIFSLPFAQPVNLLVSGSFIQTTDVIFLFVAAFFLLALFFRKIRIKFTTFYLFLAFYLLALILSTIFSIDRKLSFFKLLGEIYLIGLVVLTFNLIDTMETMKRIVFVWISAMFIVGAIGLLTVVLFYAAPDSILLSYFLHHYGTLIPGNYPRIQLTFYYPAMLCHYLSIGLMLLLIAHKNQWIKRSLFMVLLSLTLIALLFTLTPGLGAVALSIGIWLWLIFKEKFKLRAAQISLLCGICLAIAFFLVTLISPVQTETSPYFVTVPIIEKRIDPSVRLLTWQSAWETFLSYPIFGKGVGADAASVFYRDASNRLQFLTDAHQLWLNVAAQEGLIGFLAILAITLYFLHRSFPLRLGESEESVLRVGLSIAFLSAFVYQGFIGSFEEARHLWVLFGLICSVENIYSSPAAMLNRVKT